MRNRPKECGTRQIVGVMSHLLDCLSTGFKLHRKWKSNRNYWENCIRQYHHAFPILRSNLLWLSNNIVIKMPASDTQYLRIFLLCVDMIEALFFGLLQFSLHQPQLAQQIKEQTAFQELCSKLLCKTRRTLSFGWSQKQKPENRRQEKKPENKRKKAVGNGKKIESKWNTPIGWRWAAWLQEIRICGRRMESKTHSAISARRSLGWRHANEQEKMGNQGQTKQTDKRNKNRDTEQSTRRGMIISKSKWKKRFEQEKRLKTNF